MICPLLPIPMRANSGSSASSAGAQTTASWDAPNFRHNSTRWPMIVELPQGNSSFGRPIRRERPAARMATPNWNGSEPGSIKDEDAIPDKMFKHTSQPLFIGRMGPVSSSSTLYPSSDLGIARFSSRVILVAITFRQGVFSSERTPT